MKTLKSIGSVAAGFLTVVIFSVGTDAVVEGIGFFPPQDKPEEYVWWMLLIALVYRSIYTVAGGYVTARLASNNEKRHVFILACLGTLGGIAGVIIGWKYGNQWYPIALAVTAFPFTWFGGTLRTKKI
ncbi:MAG: hypothetical protein WCT99_07520 [Bacteroidota bacterium]